jgi:hypothetical protein
MDFEDRSQRLVDTVWASEEAKMKSGVDYSEREARFAAVHTLKQALQLPVGLGLILGALNTIRTSLYIAVALLAVIAYELARK